MGKRLLKCIENKKPAAFAAGFLKLLIDRLQVEFNPLSKR